MKERYREMEITDDGKIHEMEDREPLEVREARERNR